MIIIYKSCSRCGKIHDSKYICNIGKNNTNEAKLRNTYKWHMKADEIRETSNYLCEICKEERRYTYNNLEIHHIHKLRDRPDLLLDNYNLICLCTKHHKEADNGEIDMDHLLELARQREENYQ